MRNPSILLIEKNNALAALLQRQGWNARSVPEPTPPQDAPYDLVILDMDFLNHGGFDVLRRMKQNTDFADIPLILVSGLYTKDADVCRGLSEGGDDYIFKSLSEDVLVAKLQAHLRRRTPGNPAEMHSFKSKDGILTLHIPTRSAARHDRKCAHFLQHRRCGRKTCQEVVLTRTGFDILAYFLSTRGNRVLTRQDILNHVWKEAVLSVGQDVVDKHVESLRKKLGPLGGMIRTVHGVGYQLQEEP